MNGKLKTVTSDQWRVTRGFALLFLLVTCHLTFVTPASAGNDYVINSNAHPIPVNIITGGLTATGTAHEANSQVTASTTAGTLIVARATRRGCLIRNLDAAISVYIGAATVTSSNGMILTAGESVVVSGVTLYQVIAASGSPVVAVMDEYD